MKLKRYMVAPFCVRNGSLQTGLLGCFSSSFFPRHSSSPAPILSPWVRGRPHHFKNEETKSGIFCPHLDWRTFPRRLLRCGPDVRPAHAALWHPCQLLPRKHDSTQGQPGRPHHTLAYTPHPMTNKALMVSSFLAEEEEEGTAGSFPPPGPWAGAARVSWC